MIESYADLSSLGKIVYTRYKAKTITATQVQQFATLGKISQDEADFIVK